MRMRPGTASERHHAIVRNLARRHVHLTIEGAIGREQHVGAASAVRHGHRAVPPDVDVVGAAELSGALASPSQGADESAIAVQNGDDGDIGVQDEQVAVAVESQTRGRPELSPRGRIHVTDLKDLDDLRGQGTVGVDAVILCAGAGTHRNGQREDPHSYSSAHRGLLVGGEWVLLAAGWVPWPPPIR